jgi:hypothetical protein
MKSRHLSRVFYVIGLTLALVHVTRAALATLPPATLPPATLPPATLPPTTLQPATLPPGLTCTKWGQQNVCCRKAAWTDLLTFYLGNYVGHAVTTKNLPGQSIGGSIFAIVAALFWPMSGALRGVRFILSGAVFANTELQAAARAGALCMVVQDPKSNLDGFVPRQRLFHISHHVMFPSAADLFPETLNFRSTKIHGRCQMPPGYVLTVVPGYVAFEDDGPMASNEISTQTIWTSLKRIYLNIKTTFMPINQRTTAISGSYSLVKIIIAVLQALFATSTLYSSAGPQIDRFGYAAFGLTVAPYAVMSIINLLGNLICPEYSAMYIVETQTLRDVRSGSQARGVQGQLPAHDGMHRQHDQSSVEMDILPAQYNVPPAQEQTPETVQQEPPPRQEHENLCIVSTVGILTGDSDRAVARELSRSFSNPHDATSDPTIASIDKLEDDYRGSLACWLIIGIILGIIGGLSHFHERSSSRAQRVWTMIWLAFGLMLGPTAEWMARQFESREFLNVRGRLHPFFVVVCFVYGVPAIGGLVAVGQMIQAYGVCNLF